MTGMLRQGVVERADVSGGGGGGGTVTKVSVTTANGVSGSVANDTTTPAISLTLGAITPTSVNSIVLSGSGSPTLTVTGTTTVSGTNTGNQNIFSTIAVSGQSNIVADSTTDTLTVASDGTLTPTTNATTDTLTVVRAAISGDIIISSGSNTSAIGTGVIVNADINDAAAIAPTKIGGWGSEDPSDFSAIAASSSQIDLTWTDNSTYETNFVIGRSTSPSGPFTVINSPAAGSTSYSDTGLASSTTYYYQLQGKFGPFYSTAQTANATTSASGGAFSGEWRAVADGNEGGFGGIDIGNGNGFGGNTTWPGTLSYFFVNNTDNNMNDRTAELAALGADDNGWTVRFDGPGGLYIIQSLGTDSPTFLGSGWCYVGTLVEDGGYVYNHDDILTVTFTPP